MPWPRRIRRTGPHGARMRAPVSARGRRLGRSRRCSSSSLSACAAAPAPAQAIDIPDPFSIVGGAVSGGVGKLAVGAFDAIIKHLFAPIAKFITVELIGWLVAVPDFTQGNVAQLETTVCAMGGGLLGRGRDDLRGPLLGGRIRGRRRLRVLGARGARPHGRAPRCCWRCGRGCSRPRSTWPISRAPDCSARPPSPTTAPACWPPGWAPRAR